MGDLNCEMFHRSKGMPIRNICDIFGLSNTITEHTFTSTNGTSLIDVFLTNQKSKFLECGAIENSISDGHSLIYGVLKASAPLLKPRRIYYRSMKDFNEEQYLADLNLAPFHLCDIFDDIDDSYYVFNTLLGDILDTHAPWKS